MGGDHVDSRNVNPEIQQQMHGVLDDQLAAKQKQIAKGKFSWVLVSVCTACVAVLSGAQVKRSLQGW